MEIFAWLVGTCSRVNVIAYPHTVGPQYSDHFGVAVLKVLTQQKSLFTVMIPSSYSW